MEQIQDAVVAHNADLAVAFDGDADRAMFAARSGRKVDGDHVLLICGRDAKLRDRLPGNTEQAAVIAPLEAAVQQHETEERVLCFGRTKAGRPLTILYTWRHGKIRVVTAYEMTKRQQ
ncbi:MAG: hypothetical protein ACKV2U_11285 [Bryobacteraceae bacterium]